MNFDMKVDNKNRDFTVVTVKSRKFEQNNEDQKFFEDKLAVPLNENNKYIVLHSEIPLNVYRTETENEAVYTFKSNLTLFSGRGEGRKPAKSKSNESSRNKDIQQESHQSRPKADEQNEQNRQISPKQPPSRAQVLIPRTASGQSVSHPSDDPSHSKKNSETHSVALSNRNSQVSLENTIHQSSDIDSQVSFQQAMRAGLLSNM